ncbi:MAG: hypothetical protein OXG92_01140 [Chloroflexi bacterium]|nr:hypothetical protein [Chloroflexota bacterium]MCY3581986.1 hypothetical protein [Chloroflexota bacterium]MCY3715060.1 hypothetical protein [Chloroflexota bacterium]MDE2651568.1 hypothetical protein [Chloroflexota bacterium]MXV92642.1 hypothetical protein [Chloroflexota bacterium]
MSLLLGLRDKQVVDGSLIFTVLLCAAIVAMGGALSQFEIIPHPEDPLVYEWQLAEQTAWGQLTAWLGFALHQLLIWATIAYAQRRYSKRDYTDKLRPVNTWALGINFVFIILHYLQTLFFYDAIAQDLPSWTAQFAVALMLIVILGMENQRRGLFFGKKVPFRKAFTDGLRKYHGYFFSFAVIYTFWFHPMIPTLGHLVGFIHVVLVMAQGSLMFMRAHLNKHWMLLLEILVLPHAFQVAINQGNDLWPMFFFGFAAIFLVTQMHGLRLKPWARRAFYGSFTLLALYVYIFLRQPWEANEIIRIPVIEYVVLFAMYLIYWLSAKLSSGIRGLTSS